MILLRIIQGAFLAYLVAILIMFFKDYPKNREKDYPSSRNLMNYGFGFINYVLDALGIGSFAPLMAYYKLTKNVPDIQIPGTMSIGAAIPTILEAFLFMQVIEIDAKTLVLMLLASIAGTFAGVAFSKALPERGIKTMHFTGTVYRNPYWPTWPLLEITQGCSHNSCKFCTYFKDQKFRKSTVDYRRK